MRSRWRNVKEMKGRFRAQVRRNRCRWTATGGSGLPSGCGQDHSRLTPSGGGACSPQRYLRGGQSALSSDSGRFLRNPTREGAQRPELRQPCLRRQSEVMPAAPARITTLRFGLQAALVAPWLAPARLKGHRARHCPVSGPPRRIRNGSRSGPRVRRGAGAVEIVDVRIMK